ncbi:NAD(P)/FAD-dependent oxidoreductase [Patescibacteria group bacterium]|nr:NAD(P)/FAD-dependent oxidoreductase [Patescibacteria group bacterium]
MEQYDVVIVGAGPGGLCAGKKLAEAGKRVVILEKDSVIGDKVCAGGLTGKEIGKRVPKKLLGRVFDRGIVNVAGKKIIVSVPKDSVGTIPRTRLGEYMASQTEESGCPILKETEVVTIDKDHVTDSMGREYAFKYLIGADGSNSLVRKYLKVPTEKIGPTLQYQMPEVYEGDIEIYYDLKRFGPFYIWIFPHDTFTEVGTGAFKSVVPISTMRTFFEGWIKERGFDISKGMLRSAAINCDYRGFQFDNIFLVGDAAGLTDAFTGEGMFPAMVSGEEAVRKILNPDYALDNLQKIIAHKYKAEKPLWFYMKHKRFVRAVGNPLTYWAARSKRVQKKLINTFLY